MGLDQYAYSIIPDMLMEEDKDKKEIAQWRKHPNLQGWMERLWEEKGRPGYDPEQHGGTLGDFNCAPVPLSYQDLTRLEKDINEGKLPDTEGFFFGENSDVEEKGNDLEFVSKAKEEIESGREVYYDSWW